MKPTSWIEINLSRLDANVACLRRMLGAREAEARAGDPIARIGAAGGAGTSASQAQPMRVARTRSQVVPYTPPTAVAEHEPVPTPGKPMLCAVLKADAYGLGAAPLAQRLARAGADALAVFSPQQAVELVALNLGKPILVFMRVDELKRDDPLYRPAVTGRLWLTVHDREQLLALDHAGKMLGSRLSIHLMIDTGMSRGGVPIEDAPTLLGEIATLRHIKLAGVYTHLATAETDQAFVDEQVSRLDSVLIQNQEALPPDVILHVASTFAALRGSKYHRDMVRVGLGLFGYGPESLPNNALAEHARELRPITKWCSRVIQTQRRPRNAIVGYGATHKLRRDSMLGIVPAGYADGYPLALSNKATVDLPDVHVNGKPFAAPVLGRVNMDQIIIDLTDAPGITNASVVNVDLFSDDPESPCAVHKLAKLAGSSCYEMLCRLSPRVPRKHVTPAV